MQKIKDNNKSKELVIQEKSLTIQNASEIKELLMNSLDKTESLSIIDENAEELDITYLQLLLAARKSAESSGKEMILGSRHSPAFEVLINETGCPVRNWMSFEPENK